MGPLLSNDVSFGQVHTIVCDIASLANLLDCDKRSIESLKSSTF